MRSLLNKDHDLELVYCVSSCSEAFEIISKSHEAYVRGDEAFCRHYHRYKLTKTV